MDGSKDPQPANRASNEPASGAGSPWVFDADATNFERDVIVRSREVPVLVDFWATWCEPCVELGPRLERAAERAGGAFLLARVDVDKSPELAQAFRVQSIPMVVALAGGKLVDGFQGALPEKELDQFLARVVPALGGPPPVLEDARALAAGGQVERAVALLQGHVAGQPDDLAATAELAGLLVAAERVAEARALLDALPEAARQNDGIRSALARAQLAEGAGDLTALRAAVTAQPEDPAAHTALGKALLAGGDYEAGLEALLEAVRLQPEDKNSPAKRAMLEAFDVLGLDDPLANRFRFELSLVLFA